MTGLQLISLINQEARSIDLITTVQALIMLRGIPPLSVSATYFSSTWPILLCQRPATQMEAAFFLAGAISVKNVASVYRHTSYSPTMAVNRGVSSFDLNMGFAASHY